MILKSRFVNLDSWTLDIWKHKKFLTFVAVFWALAISKPRTGSGLAFECLVSYLGFQKTVSHGVSSAHGGVDSMCCLWVLGMAFSCIENQQGNGKSPCFKRRYIFKRLCFPFSCYVLGGLEGVYVLFLSMLANLWLSLVPLAPLGFWDARFVDVTHYFIYFSEAALAGDLSFVYIDTLGFRHH